MESSSGERDFFIRRLIIGAALLCVVGSAVAAPATAAPRMWFGFLDDQTFRWSPAYERDAAWSQAKSAHTSVVRTVVRWDQIAPTRPEHRLNPFDPAYNFSDLDDFVVHAQQRGIEVLLTLWGTPAWANGGAGPAVPPTDVSDFGAFAHAVAERYSGELPGLPFARFYSIWNEPNSQTFLQAPSPAVAYAGLAEAGYAAIKAASPSAVVAVGETAAAHAPGRFVDDLAAVDPTLRFDAWAHHPYPPTPVSGPDAPRAWPNAGLLELGTLDREVDRVFRRPHVPLWVTEYAESRSYVPPKRQAADLQQAIELAAAQPSVQMFVWLMLRNHPGFTPWLSGIAGTPALGVFRRAAGRFDPRNPLVQFEGRHRSFRFQLPALELRWHLTPGSRVGISYVVTNCGRRVTSGVEAARIATDGWVPVSVHFAASPRYRYELTVDIEDIHGFNVTRTLQLVPAAGSGGCRVDA